MNDLSDLYQQLILDHNRTPRNKHAMQHPTCDARGHNPLCGDRLTVFVELEGGVVKDVSFEGSGCAISQASASLMTEAVKGRPIAEVEAMFRDFHDMLTRDDAAGDRLPTKLMAFSGVRAYPARVKCATLAWHTLEAALHEKSEPVTTE